MSKKCSLCVASALAKKFPQEVLDLDMPDSRESAYGFIHTVVSRVLEMADIMFAVDLVCRTVNSVAIVVEMIRIVPVHMVTDEQRDKVAQIVRRSARELTI